MRIGVDGGALAITDKRLKVGLYRVVRNLLRELSYRDKTNEYAVYSFMNLERGVGEELGNTFKSRVLSPSFGYRSIRLPVELFIRPVEIFLGVSQMIPRTFHKSIGFVYDLGFLYHPDAYGDAANRLRKQTSDLVARASHIVAISEATKKDIVNKYSYNSDRIHVCYPGVDAMFLRDGSRYHSSRPYFLYVGSLNKAKAIPDMLEAFAQFCNANKATHDLYLVGGDYWPDPEIVRTIERLGLSDLVKMPGFVDDEDLATYYRGATAFVTTSRREGFCLPATEAMALGTPVVAYSRGALGEVVSGGGIIVPDGDVAEFVQALLKLTTNHTLRTRLSNTAKRRASLYSWNHFAEKIYALYAH